MRRRLGSSPVRLAAVLLCAIGIAPARARAQALADARALAVSARAQSQAAHDRALAAAVEARFPGVAAGAAANDRIALEVARVEAAAAANDALAAANLALPLAAPIFQVALRLFGPPPAAAGQLPSDPLTANALAASHAAQAAAHRADSALASVYEAFYREQARAALAARSPAAAAHAARATAAANQAKASRDLATAQDKQTADMVKRIAALGAVTAPSLIQAIVENLAAEARRAGAAFAATLVPDPSVPAPASLFKVDSTAPVQASINYELNNRRTGGFDVENGTPAPGAALALVATDGYRPLRVNVTLTFTHPSSGNVYTIPRIPPLRFALDNNGRYKCSDADLKRIAHDFVRIMNRIDNFTSASPIPNKDVTILIQDENGGQVDQILGGLQFVPHGI